MTFNLITSIKYYSNAKAHIASEKGTVNTQCGRHLGFDFEVVTDEGYTVGNAKEYDIKDILKIENICKKCLKTIQ
jgi:hypothetical protein